MMLLSSIFTPDNCLCISFSVGLWVVVFFSDMIGTSVIQYQGSSPALRSLWTTIRPTLPKDKDQPCLTTRQTRVKLVLNISPGSTMTLCCLQQN